MQDRSTILWLKFIEKMTKWGSAPVSTFINKKLNKTPSKNPQKKLILTYSEVINYGKQK